MSAAAGDRPLSIGLCAAVVALALATLWPWLPRPKAELPEAAPASAVPRLRETPPLASYAAIVERPLFNPTRQPAAAIAVAPQLRLDGITIIGKDRRALIRDTAANHLYRIGEGETLGPWTVGRIERDRVVLRKGSDELVLSRGR